MHPSSRSFKNARLRLSKGHALKVPGEQIHSGQLAVVIPALQHPAKDDKAAASSLLLTSHLGTTPAHHAHPKRGLGHMGALQASLKRAPTSLLLVLRGHRQKVPSRDLES